MYTFPLFILLLSLKIFKELMFSIQLGYWIIYTFLIMFYVALQLVTIVILALCAYIVHLLLSSLYIVLVDIVFFVILMTFLYSQTKVNFTVYSMCDKETD